LRYEFKYILNEATRKSIESELSYFMHLDNFVEQFEDKKYFVRSLYFDDPFFSFYYEKKDGLKHRQKFRLRTYSTQFNENIPIFLELKGRYNNFVYKHRTEIRLRNEQKNNNMELLSQIESLDNPISKQFVFDKYKKKITPVMLIDYKRRAYQSKYDYEFRITFDSELSGTHTNMLFPKNNLKNRKLIHGYTIMEVKFRKHLPPWFHRILIKYQLNRVSISKYCTGMDTTNLIQNLDG